MINLEIEWRVTSGENKSLCGDCQFLWFLWHAFGEHKSKTQCRLFTEEDGEMVNLDDSTGKPRRCDECHDCTTEF